MVILYELSCLELVWEQVPKCDKEEPFSIIVTNTLCYGKQSLTPGA